MGGGSNVAASLVIFSWSFVACEGLGGLVVRPPRLWHQSQHRWSSQREPCSHKPENRLNLMIKKVNASEVSYYNNNKNPVLAHISSSVFYAQIITTGCFSLFFPFYQHNANEALPSWPPASCWAAKRFGRRGVSHRADLSSTASLAHNWRQTLTQW